MTMERSLPQPVPINVKEPQLHLGLLKYWCVFIHHLAHVAYLFYNFIRRDALWGWDRKAHKAFEQAGIFVGLANQPCAPIALMRTTDVDDTHT